MKQNLLDIKKEYLQRVLRFGYNDTYVFRTIKDLQYNSILRD